jgi:hypothetical protein
LLTHVSFEHPHAIVPIRYVSTPPGDAANFPWPKRLNHVPRELQCDLMFTFFRSTLVVSQRASPECIRSTVDGVDHPSLNDEFFVHFPSYEQSSLL